MSSLNTEIPSPVRQTSLSPDTPVPEILAPAGGRAQFFAALRSGADAVYLGLKNFNARSRAENFTAEDLRELIPVAHHFGMKVLVTFNILIKDGELDQVVEELAQIERAGADAIIVQDLGVAALIRRFFPGLKLHASTQMAVHNLAGVEQAADLGFRRVVLAREMTSTELKKIREQVPRDRIQLETFCHGSLCYSYSGLCFFSGAADARSGNRGECAYTCREPYKVLNEPGHGFLFSMRDLDTSGSLDRLIGAGVDCLKIEGRKKDAKYVSSVVRVYRQQLDRLYGCNTLRPEARELQSIENDDEESIRKDLQLSFHRRGTSLFLKGRYVENVIDLDNPTHLGVKIGTVESIEEQGLRTTLLEPLEKHDGLRLDAPVRQYSAAPQVIPGQDESSDTRGLVARYENAVRKFPVRDIVRNGRCVFTAKIGDRVTIQLPDSMEKPVIGDVIYKERSSELKRRIDHISEPPPGLRIRALDKIGLRCELVASSLLSEQGSTLACIFSGTWGDREFYRHEYQVIAYPAKSESRLSTDLIRAFSIFGDVAIQIQSFDVELNGIAAFIRTSDLKEIKRRLGPELRAAFDHEILAHVDRAKTYLASLQTAHIAARAESVSVVPSVDARRIRVKVDRPELVECVLDFKSRNADFPLCEIIFEPKRAFCESGMTAFIQSLAERANQHGVRARIAIPTVLRAWDLPTVGQWAKAAVAAGIHAFEVGNIGTLKILQDLGLLSTKTHLTGDFTLYGLNRAASDFWNEMGIKRLALSVEDDWKNIQSHLRHFPAGLKPEIILFKDTPLFIAEACSLTALHNGCPTSKVCGYRTLEVENRAKEKFYVAHESCKSIVYGQKPYSISQHQTELIESGVRDFRVDFLTRPYNQAAMDEVLAAVQTGTAIPDTHSANFLSLLL